MNRQLRLIGIVMSILLSGVAAARAEKPAPVIIGDIYSYNTRAVFGVPYKQGWELAVEEINRSGGVYVRENEDPRQLRVLSRDDNGKPQDALRIAEDMRENGNISALMGTFLSNIAVALGDYAYQNKIPYLAATAMTDSITMEKGNDYTFRIRANSYMQGKMLAEQAAKLPAKRWATIAPNYEHGQVAVAHFKRFLSELRPDVVFVAEQFPALSKIDAGAEVQALLKAKPDAIYNVTFGPDLSAFVREGTLRGLFQGRSVVSLLMGEPEYIDPLGNEAPEGWIVTGYPYYDLDGAQKQFIQRYTEKFSEAPKSSALWGYLNVYAIKAALEKAQSSEPIKVAAALKGLEFNSPLGQFSFRAVDNQGTMGYWIGKTALRDGKGVMTEWHYANGAAYLPPEKEVKAKRPSY